MKKKNMIKAVAVLLTFVMVISSPSTVLAVNLTQVPYLIDSSNQSAWWSPLEVYGGTSYLAYDAPASGGHTIEVAKKNAAGTWSKLYCKESDGTIMVYPDDNGHNQPSVARDGDGYLHLFGSMHNSNWHYYRSEVPGGDLYNHSEDIPGGDTLVTYPVLQTAPNGDVYLFARVADSVADAGEKRLGKLFKWDNTAKSWSVIAVIGEQRYRDVYPDDLQFDAEGNLHILYEWSKYPSSTYRHNLSYMKYVPSTGLFYNSVGDQLSLPVTSDNSDIIQGMVSGEIWSNNNSYTGPAVQSAKMCVADGRVRVVYRQRETENGIFKVKSAWVSGNNWITETVYAEGNTMAALDITYTGSEKRVYFCTTSGLDRAYVAIKENGVYTYESIASGKPISRLSVKRLNNTDHLYLMDNTNNLLYYGKR